MALAPSINARCEIDLSPGTVTAPARGPVGHEIIGFIEHDPGRLPTYRSLFFAFDTTNPNMAIGGQWSKLTRHGGTRVAKTEWGAKRTCHSCGARFYDLRRETIVCPVCDTVYDPERQPRTRRGGGVIKDDVVAVSRVDDDALKKKKLEAESVDDDNDDESDTEDSEEKGGEGDMEEIKAEDSDLIEDTSDLGEDDDDIGEVMEHLDEDVEDKT
jgi:uncharacterized protein (TIGR02300 family)